MADKVVTTSCACEYMYSSAVAEDVDAVDQCGKTSLHQAADRGDKQHVEQLLAAGANLEARTRQEGQTPLHLAAAAGHADLLPLLITPNTLAAKDDSNQTALQLAVRNSQLEAARELVAAGAPMWAAPFADSPLALAMSSSGGWYHVPAGAGELYLLLYTAMLADPGSAALEEEAVGWRDECGRTFLHHAAATGSQELVAKLVGAGADRDAVGDDGATPLWYAAAAGHTALVPLLVTTGNINPPADNDLDGNSCEPALHFVARKGSIAMIAALLAAGASVLVLDEDRYSPLHWAAVAGHSHAFALLLTALKKECGQGQQQQSQQQQQQQGQEQEGQEQQGQEQQEERPSPVEVMASTLVACAKESGNTPRCAQLLGAVLDVLGPEVAEEVCLEVHRQLQQYGEQHPANQHSSNLEQVKHLNLCISLGETLLLGWLGALEQLHAAREPVVRRLQSMVLTKLADQQKKQQQFSPQQEQQQQQEGRGPLPHVQARLPLLVQLVKEATLAAAAGRQQEALRLLGEFAAVHLQQQQDWQQQQQQQQQQQEKVFTKHAHLPPVEGRVHWALQEAARAIVQKSGCTGQPPSPAEVSAACCLPPAVYTTFLAAWVGARRQLQQVPQEVVTTVVAAVTVAEKQCQKQQQQEEEGSGAGQASQEEQHLPSQLSGLLREAGKEGGSAGGG